MPGCGAGGEREEEEEEGEEEGEGEGGAATAAGSRLTGGGQGGDMTHRVRRTHRAHGRCGEEGMEMAAARGEGSGEARKWGRVEVRLGQSARVCWEKGRQGAAVVWFGKRDDVGPP